MEDPVFVQMGRVEEASLAVDNDENGIALLSKKKKIKEKEKKERTNKQTQTLFSFLFFLVFDNFICVKSTRDV